MSRSTIPLSDPLLAYLVAHSLRDHPVLARLRQETAAALGRTADWQISPEQGQLMTLLVELTGARRVLELGCFTGYSSLLMALALPPDGRILTLDIRPDYTAIARRAWAEAEVADKVELRLGPALATLDRLLEREGAGDSFDMAFIDADKLEVTAYYERCLRLVRPGGLLMVDNVLWRGRVADPADQADDTRAMRALNARIHGDPRVTPAIIPVGDGLTLARRRA